MLTTISIELIDVRCCCCCCHCFELHGICLFCVIFTAIYCKSNETEIICTIAVCKYVYLCVQRAHRSVCSMENHVHNISRRSRMKSSKCAYAAYSRSRICILTHHWVNRLKRIYIYSIGWSIHLNLKCNFYSMLIRIFMQSLMHIANTQVN